MDKLDTIFERQIALQKRLYSGIPVWDNDYIKINHLALENELHEALRETPWKPWKKNQGLNKENFQKELIDALHFFINLCLAAEMSPSDLFNKYIQKNNENHTRQNNGY